MKTTYRLFAGIVAAVLLFGTMIVPAAAAGPRIDLRVLLLTSGTGQPSVEAWESTLQREGTPYDVVDVAATDLSSEQLEGTLPDGAPNARYQAVIVGTHLAWLAMDDAERAAVQDFERRFNIRQVTTYAYPSPDYGLNWPEPVDQRCFSLGNRDASLTEAGKVVFPYLNGVVPIDPGAYGCLATPADAERFTPLVLDASGDTLVGTYRRPGTDTEPDIEEMVLTVDSNKAMTHARLLSHGMLRWVTRGVYLGYARNALTMHIDDILIGDDRWDIDANSDETGLPTIYMSSADVNHAVTWSRKNSFRFDFLYNAEGAVVSPKHPALATFLSNRNQFRWMNHTYSHHNLDFANRTTIEAEIRRNIDWATKNKVNINKAELVTGEHSGLANPAMPAALTNTGIRWVGADNSRQPEPYRLGSATTVPRHPMNIFYNAGRWAEQLDEYNFLYRRPPEGTCVDTSVTTCRTTDITQSELVDLEATIMLGHVLDNDPRPHYGHEANLAEDRILYPVLDEVLRRYRRYFNSSAPLQQPTFTEIGGLLTRLQRWNAAVAAGRVSAYLQDGQLVVNAPAATPVPITGVQRGASYAGAQSGWFDVKSGRTSFTLAG